MFKRWFSDKFIPTVKSYLIKIEQKLILLIDSTPYYPLTKELKTKTFNVTFLPPNDTLFVQPFDSVIQTVTKETR